MRLMGGPFFVTRTAYSFFGRAFLFVMGGAKAGAVGSG